MLRRGVVHAVPTDDGLTYPFYILSHEVPPLHPPLRGTYRPVGLQERADIQTHLAGKTGVAWDRAVAECLVPRLKSWDATAFAPTDESGQRGIVPLPISKDSILTLEPDLYNSLVSVVLFSSRASDTDPEWSSEEVDMVERARVQAVATGRPVADVLTELQAKNSKRGSG